MVDFSDRDRLNFFFEAEKSRKGPEMREALKKDSKIFDDLLTMLVDSAYYDQQAIDEQLAKYVILMAKKGPDLELSLQLYGNAKVIVECVKRGKVKGAEGGDRDRVERLRNVMEALEMFLDRKTDEELVGATVQAAQTVRGMIEKGKLTDPEEEKCCEIGLSMVTLGAYAYMCYRYEEKGEEE